MVWSVVLNWVLGGGMVAAVTALVTMRAAVVRANADAEKARAESDTVKITNTENATRILLQNIVDPLRQELNETRKELNSFRREVARLRKAIDGANSCDYRDGCPVLERMRERKEGSEDGCVSVSGRARQSVGRQRSEKDDGKGAAVGDQSEGNYGESEAVAGGSQFQ